MSTDTARDIADGVMQAGIAIPYTGRQWRKAKPAIAFRDAIEAALLAYGNARIEEAAKVADDDEGAWDADDLTKFRIASAIRSLATKEAP